MQGSRNKEKERTRSLNCADLICILTIDQINALSFNQRAKICGYLSFLYLPRIVKEKLINWLILGNARLQKQGESKNNIFALCRSHPYNWLQTRLFISIKAGTVLGCLSSLSFPRIVGEEASQCIDIDSPWNARFEKRGESKNKFFALCRFHLHPYNWSKQKCSLVQSKQQQYVSASVSYPSPE